MAYRSSAANRDSTIFALEEQKVWLKTELELARKQHGQVVSQAAEERERVRRWAEARFAASTRVLKERLDSALALEREETRALRQRVQLLEREVEALLEGPAHARRYLKARLAEERARQRIGKQHEIQRLERVLSRLYPEDHSPRQRCR